MKLKSPLKTSGSKISSFSSVLGITLVLTMVGWLFILLLLANAVTAHFKEQITVQVMLKSSADEAEVLEFKKRIEGEPYSGAVEYTSSEAAAELMQKELGEEFVDFLGFNPLPASLDIKINPNYSGLDSLETQINELGLNPLVQEVVYQRSLLQHVNDNIAKWGLGLFILGSLFLIIAVVLIVNTIELAIFSQRFIIKSMQLVGATNWFIQKPFLKRGLSYGLTASVFALAIIFAILYGFKAELADVIAILMEGQRMIALVLCVVACGCVVSWLATAYAVRRFIRLRQDDLY